MLKLDETPIKSYDRKNNLDDTGEKYSFYIASNREFRENKRKRERGIFSQAAEILEVGIKTEILNEKRKREDTNSNDENILGNFYVRKRV